MTLTKIYCRIGLSNIDRNLRRFEVFNTDKNIWEITSIPNIKVGDLFRIFEADGVRYIDARTGKNEWICAEEYSTNTSGVRYICTKI